MDINKLLIDTSNNINELLALNNRSKRSIISDNLSNIEVLSANGVSYRQILISGNIPIALKHFHDLIYRAKKKRDASAIEGQKVAVTPTPVDNVKHQKPQPTPETYSKVIGRFSDSDWKAIGIHNEYLISVLQETDLTPEEVKAWNCPNQIQLSTRVNEYRMRKMKRK